MKKEEKTKDQERGIESEFERELSEGLFVLEMEERLEMMQALDNDVVTSCCDDF